jgi:iron(III) transport system permease protein
LARRIGLTRQRLAGIFEPRRTVLLLTVAVVAALAVVPLFFLVWNTFKPVAVGNLSDFSLDNFTLKNFREVLSEARSFLLLRDSFIFAFGSVLVAYIFGGTIAFLVERTNTPYRNIMYGLMFVPLIMPGMLKAIGWVLLMGPRAGLLNQLWFGLGFENKLFDAFTIPAMFYVEGLSLSPLTFFLLGATLRGMDPSLEEAAYTSGAGRTTTMLRVTLRLMVPALAGVGLLNFVRALESFEVPLIMGFPSGIKVFATQIYTALRNISPPDYGEGFVLSLTMIILAVAGLLYYQRLMRRSERYATVTGKGYRPRLLDLGSVGRPLAASFLFLFFLLAVILPFLILIWASLLPFYQVPWQADLSRVSLDNYWDLFARWDFGDALLNIAILAGVAGSASMLLATVISWVVLRLRPRGSQVLDGLVFLPYAIPGIAIGFSMMIIFLTVPRPFSMVYGTIWIIVIAYVVNFLPIATRFTHAGVAQLKAELEEAAMASGAGMLTMMRRILLPLMLPTLVAGGLYIVLLSSRIMSIAIILYTPDSIVLSIFIYQLWTEGTMPQVGALAVVMVFGLTALTILSRKLAQRRGMQVER